ncbi:hypothetical protein [Paenibacillus dauci]|uniref:hypothetical protein n=1 Tax=Paenibacillus dauci TaxID=1567106 RepID=UPI0006191544|nr:hypothetical protein [Paenibacillus dauci]
MQEYWDELFLDIHNQRIINDEMNSRETDDSWMNWSVEECIHGLESGHLTGKDEQEWRVTENSLYEGRLILHLPESFTENHQMRIDQSSESIPSYMFQDKQQQTVIGVKPIIEKINDDQVNRILDRMLEQTKQAQPNMEIMTRDILYMDAADTNIPYYETVFLLKPDPFMQILFIRTLAERSFIVSMQFKLENVAHWQPLAHAICCSMRWLEE